MRDSLNDFYQKLHFGAFAKSKEKEASPHMRQGRVKGWLAFV
jgi:hypothetical protein